MARLTKQCFDLDADDPSVLVKAGAKNKYKNERRIPLRADTAALLKEYLAPKMPNALAFNVPTREQLR